MKVQIKHDKQGNISSFFISAREDGLLELVAREPETAVTEVDVPEIDDKLTVKNQDYIAESLAKIIRDSKVDLTSKRLVTK